ncbi:MAG: xanthine dehydrogenase family protein subunit M [Pirellulales bacterium]|nr:xanthine dehydrogenase family protein subunit M [Pirellulales bacterium]
MHSFEYSAPHSLSDAVSLLAQAEGNARPLAGGTDLIDQMQTGRFRPALVIDIKKLPELNVLEFDGDGLHLGAAVPCYRIYGEPRIVQEYSALADACHIIGGVQIQSRASVGGNLCNSGPAADSTPAMIALSAICVIAGPGETRQVPVEEFCTAPGENVLRRGEILAEILFPPRPANSGSHYRRFIPRNEMDIAVVGVGAFVELEDDGQTIKTARIGLGAVAPTPLLAEDLSASLSGKPATDSTFVSAGEAARQIITPITDMRGTAEYRKQITGVLVQRVLATATARARGEPSEYKPGK